MGKILLEGMEFFAYHGCFKEEQLIGTKFIVDIEVEFDTDSAEKSDHLHDTLNYQEVYRIVKKEMEIRSNLLEHVARRILTTLKTAYPATGKTMIKIAKLIGMNPTYIRMTGDATLTITKNGKEQEKMTTTAIWEQMNFGSNKNAIIHDYR